MEKTEKHSHRKSCEGKTDAEPTEGKVRDELLTRVSQMMLMQTESRISQNSQQEVEQKKRLIVVFLRFFSFRNNTKSVTVKNESNKCEIRG